MLMNGVCILGKSNPADQCTLYKSTSLTFNCLWIKDALSGLRQFLATESPLKWWNAFYFTSKALSVLKIFKFLSWLFGHVSKRLD